MLILPIALMMYAMMAVLAQGMAVKRNVVYTAHTITDIVAQQNTSISTANLDAMLGASAAVMTPWSSAQLSIVVSELQINANGTGTVQWSRAAYGGTARAVGSIVPAPTSNFTAGGYQILGEVAYNFQPMRLYLPVSANINLSEGFYEGPRNSTSIALTP